MTFLKPTDFSKHLTDFLSSYLPLQENVSKNTIASYCDAFSLLLTFCRDIQGIPVEKVTLKTINSALIVDFLAWLQNERGCGIPTRNVRLAAVHSFFRYLQAESPSNILICQEILKIPFKKHGKPKMSYLSVDELKLIFDTPDTSKQSGRRDLTMLCVLYDTGARVQELIDLTVKSVRLENPEKIILHGKGNKSREVPLLPNTVLMLKNYLAEHRLNVSDKQHFPLFFNSQRDKLTRAGVSYVLKKYVDKARISSPLIPMNVTPHVLRHSKAMHLLQSGVNILYIRDILGHVDISTTEVYARADVEMKRTAMEKANLGALPVSTPSWATDSNMITWLKQYGKVRT